MQMETLDPFHLGFNEAIDSGTLDADEGDQFRAIVDDERSWEEARVEATDLRIAAPMTHLRVHRENPSRKLWYNWSEMSPHFTRKEFCKIIIRSGLIGSQHH